MYGVPHDLDLSRFVGATLIQVCLGEFQVQFHFQAADTAGSEEGLSIGVEGRWELRDKSGGIVDHSQENAKRESYQVHRLLGDAVAETDLDATAFVCTSLRTGQRTQNLR